MKYAVRAIALPIALAGTLVLSACGAGSNDHDMSGASGAMKGSAAAGATPATGAKAGADVDFATMMIPHHAQAIAMADMALKQATDAKVKAVAARIKAAQGPEVVRMTGWLTGWGAPLPKAEDAHGMSGMGADTGGMMSADEMAELDRATGPAFDRMWLQMMVRHHQGAVAMATTELAKGANPEGKQLAQSIIDSQTVEIAELNKILAGLSG